MGSGCRNTWMGRSLGRLDVREIRVRQEGNEVALCICRQSRREHATELLLSGSSVEGVHCTSDVTLT